jgi:hypothetical protein
MAESLGDSPEDSANGGKAEGAAQSQKNTQHESAPRADKPYANLPMVVAPKLGAGDEEIDEDEIDDAEASGDSAATPTSPPSTRFMVLAASVAFAAAFGSFVGSVSGSGLAHIFYPAAAPAPVSNTQTINDAVRALKLELSNTIKADLDNASRSANAQLARLGDRLDRLDPRASAAPDMTGSVLPPAAVPAKLTDRILADWVVQDVQNGRALVESRYGGLFDVGAGSMLPGLGRVENVRRQDGQWVVITARGMITSGR